eukprot:superscaffoldBa00000027_g539
MTKDVPIQQPRGARGRVILQLHRELQAAPKRTMDNGTNPPPHPQGPQSRGLSHPYHIPNHPSHHDQPGQMAAHQDPDQQGQRT